MTKAEIPQSILQGGKSEEVAIQCLMQLCWKSVTRFVNRKGGTYQDGEDIFMEGLTEVITQLKLGKFRGEAAITTYLISVCKKMWYNRLRKLKREVYESEDEEGVRTTSLSRVATYLNEPDNQDKVAQISQFLETSLGSTCKEILLLEMERYKTKEILELLDGYSNPASIDNKRSQCRKKLRKKLADFPSLQEWLDELIEP